MTHKQPRRTPRSGVDEYGRGPIHYAARDGNDVLVRQLLASGASPSSQDDNGWSPLHFAMQGTHIAVAEALLDVGAAIDAADIHGNSPLWVAVINDRTPACQLVRLLLSRGANPEQQNSHGRSPRDLAYSIGGMKQQAFEKKDK
jgi:uncharacterized protein